MSSRYEKSNRLLQRALKVIPLGSQTFSKSYTQYPEKSAPLYLQRGEKGRVWDVDGNEYVDLVNGLLPVILGYRDNDVDQAIKLQLEQGISFSLATELEVQLAERLVEIIPCAEMVRYGKNGSDVTSAAIRLARAFTKRDHIAVCGYHGWHDWYIGSTVRNLGIPQAVCRLTHHFEYNNLDSLHRLFKAHPDEIAAVIMEPMNNTEPYPGFLEEVKQLAHKNGALFIFDEIITGFRYHIGGAQSLFNVIPDLATFGKGMANGMPLSAIVGRADIMKLMEEIYYSGTFAGETLSLAASIAVIDKMQREPVIEDLWEKGKKIAHGVSEKIADYELQDIFYMSGKPPWTFLNILDYGEISTKAIRTLFIREMLANGILMLGTHNISYAHTQEDISQVINAYKHVLSIIKEEIKRSDFEQRLGCAVLEPVFTVRSS